ncbi:MAG: PCRF domain-containing protein [Phycisphaerales bacterium JB043]
MSGALGVTLNDTIRATLDELSRSHDSLASQLEDPEVLADHRKVRDISIRKSALEPVVSRYHELLRLETESNDLRDAIEGGDAELAEMARDELPQLQQRAQELLDTLLADLVTSDDRAVASVIVEIRAGVGGDESSIWAGDLLDMLTRYASTRGWTIELDDAMPGTAGGFKHASATVQGEGVWTALAHEAGVHCVKRVPKTESQGRIHTSTATVAVLPEPDEVQLEIDPGDVEEHITTAQGPGGQNVNKVATAVHLIHSPTGVEVRMQESKSQRQNREKAWRLLRARLYDIERQKQAAERAAERAGQIGTGGRAERVRTYRYKEDIVVDHRLSESFPLARTLGGELEPIHDALQQLTINQRLEAL